MAAPAVIIVWTATASFATFMSADETLPMSLPNTLTLVAVGTMLLMLLARTLTARTPHDHSQEHIIPVERPGMNAKDLLIVLFPTATCGYALTLTVFDMGTHTGSLHWLASVYAAHGSLLHVTVSSFQRKHSIAGPEGATP